jgi:hypothetical protein
MVGAISLFRQGWWRDGTAVSTSSSRSPQQPTRFRRLTPGRSQPPRDAAVSRACSAAVRAMRVRAVATERRGPRGARGTAWLGPPLVAHGRWRLGTKVAARPGDVADSPAALVQRRPAAGVRRTQLHAFAGGQGMEDAVARSGTAAHVQLTAQVKDLPPSRDRVAHRVGGIKRGLRPRSAAPGRRVRAAAQQDQEEEPHGSAAEASSRVRERPLATSPDFRNRM